MRQSKAQRAELVEVFREAKKHLDTGNGRREDYICLALAKTSRPWSTVASARKVIMSRLSPYTSVRTYLKEGVRAPRYQLTYASVQDFRHRWLDALIKEFSS